MSQLPVVLVLFMLFLTINGLIQWFHLTVLDQIFSLVCPKANRLWPSWEHSRSKGKLGLYQWLLSMRTIEGWFGLWIKLACIVIMSHAFCVHNYACMLMVVVIIMSKWPFFFDVGRPLMIDLVTQKKEKQKGINHSIWAFVWAKFNIVFLSGQKIF